MELSALRSDFGVEVRGIGLIDAASSDSVYRAARDAFEEHSVLLFREQDVTDDVQAAFSRAFGPLERVKIGSVGVGTFYSRLHNIAADGNLVPPTHQQALTARANQLWHTDSSFKRLPARASLLYARSIPPIGGHTEFADERAAYDALPEETKRRLDSLVAEHSIFNSRARLGFTNFSDEERQGMPPVPQVVVRTIPESGRKSLYLASHAGRILGMSEDDGRALIDGLVTHATQRQFVYTHRWRVHDLVIWDNRCTMHRGTDFDDLRWKRDMQRATVSDVANSCEQEGVAVAAA